MTNTVDYELAMIRESVENIEQQLDTNLGYFSGDDLATLKILQTHIKEQTEAIRRNVTLIRRSTKPSYDRS